ncbi:MAG: serine--tRNA ligase [Patescibacteria group bacterium]
MLDINFIRKNSQKVKESCEKKNVNADIDKILELDKKKRELMTEIETLKAEQNKISRGGKENNVLVTQAKEIKDKIKSMAPELESVEKEFNELLSELPNIVADDVVAGGKKNNKVLRQFGKKPKFNFTPKDHVELATNLNLIDYERGAKISGSGFWVYKGNGAILEWALLNYFIDFHRRNKYTFLLAPYMLTEKSAYTSGNLPKFRDDLFWTQDKLCLNATSEMMLGNYHRDEVLKESDLPLKYFSYSACFRREAGSYRKEERGMIRGHQFNKIEMFQFTRPEKSWEAFEELVKNAEKLTDGLDLHFQSVQLAAEDMTEAMAKTIDIEVWIPSMGIYKEVSSASNALEYQARRGNIKFRNEKEGKNYFVHTLNASGLATSRLIPAILEQFQQKDGGIKVPKVLQKYCGFNVIK